MLVVDDSAEARAAIGKVVVHTPGFELVGSVASGEEALDAVSRLGLAVDGVTNINLPEAAIKTLMLGSAARTIVVADGSKLGRVHLGRVAPLSAFDALVTDAAANPFVIAGLREAGLDVLLPDEA